MFLGYGIGSALMLIAAIVEWTLGFDSEGKMLEEISTPITAVEEEEFHDMESGRHSLLPSLSLSLSLSVSISSFFFLLSSLSLSLFLKLSSLSFPLSFYYLFSS